MKLYFKTGDRVRLKAGGIAPPPGQSYPSAGVVTATYPVDGQMRVSGTLVYAGYYEYAPPSSRAEALIENLRVNKEKLDELNEERGKLIADLTTILEEVGFPVPRFDGEDRG